MLSAFLLLLPSVLDAVPWDAVDPIADAVEDGELTRAEMEQALPQVLDLAVDWSKVIEGPVGVAAEKLDGPVAKLLVKVIAGVALDRAKKRRAKPSVRPAGAFTRHRPAAG